MKIWEVKLHFVVTSFQSPAYHKNLKDNLNIPINTINNYKKYLYISTIFFKVVFIFLWAVNKKCHTFLNPRKNTSLLAQMISSEFTSFFIVSYVFENSLVFDSSLSKSWCNMHLTWWDYEETLNDFPTLQKYFCASVL